MADSSKQLQIVITAKNDAEKTLQGLNRTLKENQKNLKAMAIAGTVAFTAIAVASITSVKSAIQARDEQARLTAVLKNATDATDSQIQALHQQAEALERVGVIDAGVIKSAQTKLATFDLTTRAIGELTPALLDYAVAEYGASVSGEQLANVANGFGKALQGNTELLTKAGFKLTEHQKGVLETGTETQRLAMMNEILGKTYDGVNEKMRQTTAGGIKGMQMEMDRLKDSIGESLMPAFESLINKISPIITRVVDWTERNKDLVRGIIVGAGVITGLIAILGTLGVAFVVAKASAIALGTTIYALAGPIGWIIGAIALLGAGAGFTAYQLGKQKAETTALAYSSDTLMDSMGGLSDEITGAGDRASETAKRLTELNKQMADIIAQGAKSEADAKRSLAELFIDQENKVADIKKELEEKKREYTKSSNQEQSADTRRKLKEEMSDLRAKLEEEKLAITNNQAVLVGLEA
jgi:hypothetical protein